MKFALIKTKEELLKDGNENIHGDIIPINKQELIMFNGRMSKELIGKIVKVEQDGNTKWWAISEWMIKKYIDPEEYPEYFI